MRQKCHWTLMKPKVCCCCNVGPEAVAFVIFRCLENGESYSEYYMLPKLFRFCSLIKWLKGLDSNQRWAIRLRINSPSPATNSATLQLKIFPFSCQDLLTNQLKTGGWVFNPLRAMRMSLFCYIASLLAGN